MVLLVGARVSWRCWRAGAQALEASADAAVDESVADAHLHAAEERRDRPARSISTRCAGHAPRGARRGRRGSASSSGAADGHDGLHDALAARVEAPELAGDRAEARSKRPRRTSSAMRLRGPPRHARHRGACRAARSVPRPGRPGWRAAARRRASDEALLGRRRGRRATPRPRRRARRSRRPPPRSDGPCCASAPCGRRSGRASRGLPGRGAVAATWVRNSSTSRRSRVAVHRLADDLAGGEQRQLGDLGAHVAPARAGARPRCRRRRASRSRSISACVSRDALLADLVGHALGARDDVAGLATSLGQDGLALVGRRLAVAPRRVRVLETLLDAQRGARRACPGPARGRCGRRGRRRRGS